MSRITAAERDWLRAFFERSEMATTIGAALEGAYTAARMLRAELDARPAELAIAWDLAERRRVQCNAARAELEVSEKHRRTLVDALEQERAAWRKEYDAKIAARAELDERCLKLTSAAHDLCGHCWSPLAPVRRGEKASSTSSTLPPGTSPGGLQGEITMGNSAIDVREDTGAKEGTFQSGEGKQGNSALARRLPESQCHPRAIRAGGESAIDPVTGVQGGAYRRHLARVDESLGQALGYLGLSCTAAQGDPHSERWLREAAELVTRARELSGRAQIVLSAPDTAAEAARLEVVATAPWGDRHPARIVRRHAFFALVAIEGFQGEYWFSLASGDPVPFDSLGVSAVDTPRGWSLDVRGVA